MSEQDRAFLIKYAYSSDCPSLADYYQDLIMRADDRDVEDLKLVYTTYVHKFFEPGTKQANGTYTHKNPTKRTAYNILREQFLHLAVQALEKKHPNARIFSQFNFPMMFASFSQTVRGMNDAETTRIFNDIIALARKQGWWSKSYEFYLLEPVYELRSFNMKVETFDTDANTLAISINNRYVYRSKSAEDFQKDVAAVSFAYERRLLHGVEINLSDVFAQV